MSYLSGVRLSKAGLFELERINPDTKEVEYCPLTDYWSNATRRFFVEPGATYGNFWSALSSLDSFVIEALGDRAQCPVLDFIKEAELPPTQLDNSDDVVVKSLVIRKTVDIHEDHMDSFVDFGGNGLVRDVNSYGDNDFHPMGISVTFSPVNQLTQLPLEIADTATVALHGAGDTPTETRSLKTTVTLDEVVHAILWEISFYGGPQDRAATAQDIHFRMDEIGKWIEEGTLEQNTFSSEEFFERMNKALGYDDGD